MDRYRIAPDTKVKLSEFDPEDTSLARGGKDEAKSRTAELTSRLAGLQDILYAQYDHKILVVLQGMDTSGKDGAIRHVFGGINPQGVRVANFKAPTPEELDHDYLWRVHKQVPGKGELVIFNRSHYEDVLIVRVHELVPEKVWKRRYDEINNFEQLLSESGTTILKFYLHISKDEQKKRLEDRRDTPRKQWKFRIRRHQRTRAVGRLHAGLPGCDRPDKHPVGALVRGSCQSRVVPGPRRRFGRGRMPGRPGHALSRAKRRPEQDNDPVDLHVLLNVRSG